MTDLQRTILLVEDNPMDVDLTLEAFRRIGLKSRIELARDGQELLDLIPRWSREEEAPCVILLDLKLPKVGAIEVLRELRDNLISRYIPVVVLTTSGAPSDIEDAYACGANSYIVKPVVFERFLEIVAMLDAYWVHANRTVSFRST